MMEADTPGALPLQPERLELFAQELVKPGITQAEALRAAFPKQAKKWKETTVWSESSRLANDPKVRARVSHLMKSAAHDAVMSRQETLLRVSKIARADLRDCYHLDGTLKGPHDMDDNTAAALVRLETTEEGKGAKRVTSRKVELAKPTVALEMLMKHHGLYGKDNAQRADPVRELLELIDGGGRGRGASVIKNRGR